jgi:hypothetical protein
VPPITAQRKEVSFGREHGNAALNIRTEIAITGVFIREPVK